MSGPERDLDNLPGEGYTEKRFPLPYHKIVEGEDVALQIVREWQAKGFQVVFCDAVLDIPHYRHADYFLACANYGDGLVVRLATDELVREAKDPEGPIIVWTERAKHAAHYPYIDLIVPKTRNGWEWVADFRPSLIVNSITSPVLIIKQLEEDMAWLTELGVRIVALDEFAREIPVERLYEECVMYNENKFAEDKLSGTVIRERIRQRAIKDYLNREIEK